MTSYCCPNCKTNRTRFNIIEQKVYPVKLDPHTGEVVEQYESILNNPLHLPYNGPEKRVQCAVCGLIEDEKMFIRFGEKK